MAALAFEPDRMSAEQRATRAEEQALVARALEGDVSAFEALYRNNVGRVYAVCLRMTANPARAEDCAQEAFVRAWRQLHRFRGASAFGTWLHRIAVNEVLSRQRRDSRRGAHLQLVGDPEDAPGIRSSDTDPSAEMDLEKAVGELPEGARNVFVLYSLNGYSHQETAELLGVAVGTCKAQLHRARKLLVKRLGL